MTQYKIDKLELLGIDWSIYVRPGWEKQYEELVRFKKKNGHCRVPQKFKENKSLANWVSIQRRDKYKLSEEQIEKLNAVGFIWKVLKR
ncbi:MAG: hypothetical protein A2275_06045 [Bacteroidetes bacterium RIFOXYA12_FULL_35_11]|nr:MAG: hypothetical protein A2X01_14935 [Bacteroidetes bacterium GWF2_35_48]OFY74004.1 MAG: hypothetical protein A2275_06045 [Bacteroidetes bacterium RIFOXYA12_FULL_35_11]HBX50144.1 hypothetical protein [Bacteroidales bacterium]